MGDSTLEMCIGASVRFFWVQTLDKQQRGVTILFHPKKKYTHPHVCLMCYGGNETNCCAELLMETIARGCCCDARVFCVLFITLTGRITAEIRPMH